MAVEGRAIVSRRVSERSSDRWQRIYEVVLRVPAGKVATYGQIASVAGLQRGARQVGYALHALADESEVPWHRVLNARGEISARATPGWDGLQRKLLEVEGVRFDERGRVDLSHDRWEP